MPGIATKTSNPSKSRNRKKAATHGEGLGPASDTAATLEAMCPGYSFEEELEEREESLPHRQTAARADVHWDEASTDEESEEEPQTTEGERGPTN